MKIALYIEDGLEQIVLTPESGVEKDLAFKLVDHNREIQSYRGSFYACKGGWVRQGSDEDSVMLVLRRIEDVEQDKQPGIAIVAEEGQ